MTYRSSANNDATNINESTERVHWRSNLFCVADARKLTDRERVLCENAYRRGFAQGFASCVMAFDMKATFKQINKLYLKIMDWRYKRHEGNLVVPPELAKSKTGVEFEEYHE